jgi:hypothetical protein
MGQVGRHPGAVHLAQGGDLPLEALAVLRRQEAVLEELDGGALAVRPFGFKDDAVGALS